MGLFGQLLLLLNSRYRCSGCVAVNGQTPFVSAQRGYWDLVSLVAQHEAQKARENSSDRP